MCSAIDECYKVTLSSNTVVHCNICGAIKLGKKLGPNKKIVTILCDDANKYYDKMFNKEYLQSKNLPIPDWL